jgi:uncharacterized protein YdaU (DUF1376 family)
MSKPDTYMPLVIGDYLKDTMHLDAAEHGAYLMLLMHYWVNGALPDDDRKLSAISRCSPSEWPRIRETIADFFDIDGGFWKHGRVEKELNRAKTLQERAITAGRASATKRQLKPNKTSTKAATKSQLKSNPATATPFNRNDGGGEESGGDGYGTVPVDWQDRLNRYQPGRYWPDTYGPRPEREGPWDAPKPLVLAWRAKHGIGAGRGAKPDSEAA